MPGKTKRGHTVPKFVNEGGSSSSLSILSSRPFLGAVTAAVMAASPRLLLLHPTLTQAAAAHSPPALNALAAAVPDRLVAAILGFGVGYGGARGLAWARKKLLQSLFTYTGWIYNSRSRTTQLWALLVKVLQGPGPHSTMSFQPLLPKQPLPDLDATLDRWIAVLEPLLTPAELEQTKEAVEQFRKNEGPQLQAYLQKRSEEKVNWLSEYWLTAAYLAGRSPTAVNSNFYVCNHVPKTNTTDFVSRAAQVVFYSCQFSQHVRDGTLYPSCLQDLVPLCMSGSRFLFNSCRLPGEHMDTISKIPGKNHVVVIRKGHYYKMDSQAPDANGQMRLLTQTEIRNQLIKIIHCADQVEREAPVAALTSQNRTIWSKQREELLVKNKETLADVEGALFVLVLDEHFPKDKHEHASLMLTGSGNDRWFDKSFNSVVFEDASGGANVEHSVIDATVMGSLFEYCMYNEAYLNGKLIPDPKHPDRDIPSPKRLMWDLTGMEDAVQEAFKSYKQLADNLDMKVLNTRYGREFMKRSRTSPDAYIQMALQLAYYRLHKEIVKTYEPSTGRLFALGRTETVHPVSAHSVAWVKAMDDKITPNEKKVALLRAAAKHQTQYRLDATVGQGCDRHLLGLYCASRELGTDIPAIFRDKGWQLPFKLSTSQTPTRFYEWGLNLDVDRCGGGFAPNTEDGYGIAYFHVGDDQINIHISSWNSCPTTSSMMFVNTLDQVFEDMKPIFNVK